jgi:antitoxin component YwqK of YwqJK toxin-antitoxin module
MKRYFLIFIGLIFSILLLISCKDKLTSVVTNYNENGTPQKILYYDIKGKDSILMKSVEYHKNNTVYIEGNYKNGKRNGEWKSWYENGNLRYSGNYDQESKRTGTWNFYDENNNLIQTIEY